MSKEWNDLSEEKKAPFKEESEENKRRYVIEMAAYKEKKAAEAVAEA